MTDTGRKHDTAKAVLTAGSEGWGFYTLIFAGVLLGWGADHWLGTRPIFIVAGLLAGSAVAFWKLWRYLKGNGQ